MKQILIGVLDAIIESEYKHFFNNLEKMFSKAYLDRYEFAKLSKNLSRETNPRKIILSYIEAFIKECPQLQDRVNEDGSISRALITANAVIGELENDIDYYISYFITRIFTKANYSEIISKKEYAIVYMWLNLTQKYQLKDEK